MSPPQLTLVAAATLTNGLGLKGGLPWRLPREMAYFARTTSAAGISPSATPNAEINAVVMGRKSWESIPPKFRPLKGRLNVVISSQAELKLDGTGTATGAGAEATPTPVLANSLNEALSYLSNLPASSPPFKLRNIFIIGGASIYTQALQNPNATRILLTRVIEPAYEECDVFFPEIRENNEWVRARHAQLVEWVGFDVPEGVQEEKGTKYEFQMWVKEGGEGSL
ncbi:hypothetical protein BDV93DRAFT_518273 [Ceratobasidium sp. AG-I]|nr:hypothetical protein BDV93DRAFT_518273 [Ceratobasidium sp. AG-I]